MRALAGKHSLNISLRISVKRSPFLTSVMNTVIVTMSSNPRPPTALMFLSNSEKICRTCPSKSRFGAPVSLSGLPEPLLLDAAHIVADKDEQLGHPVIANGIPLSKIHHAAFDAHHTGRHRQ
jgi:hypothetical protein